MSDRHVRRSGSDYLHAFLALLPFGYAWPRQPDSTLVKTCAGLNEFWGFVDGRAADLLEIESDPRTTVELLPDWERNWGLPDPCYSAPQTIGQRQLALVMRMTMLGAQSRANSTSTSRRIIGYTITITEYRVFVVGIDRCGDNRVYGDGSNPMFDEWNKPICDPTGNPVAEGELSEWPNYGTRAARQSLLLDRARYRRITHLVSCHQRADRRRPTFAHRTSRRPRMLA